MQQTHYKLRPSHSLQPASVNPFFGAIPSSPQYPSEGSSTPSFRDRSVTFLRPTKPQSIYKNLVDVVKPGNAHTEKRKSEQGLALPGLDETSLEDLKKQFLKTKSATHPQLRKKDGNQTQQENQDYQDAEMEINRQQAPQGFVNRFKSQIEAAELMAVTDPADVAEEVPFRHLLFSKDFFAPKKDFLRHLQKIKKGLIYAKHQIKPPAEEKIALKAVPLDPLPEGKKTLVLDLDDTLVHVTNHGDPGHVRLTMKSEDGETKTFGIRFRPYLNYFLEQVSKKYEIVIFTAGQENYATTVVNYIDPENKYINYVISRDHCLVTKNGLFLKDLRVLSNRNLKDVLIVDNIPHNFCFQIGNGIPILEYHDNSDDQELKYLAKYLLKCAEMENTQEYNEQALNLKGLLDVNVETYF